MRSEDGERLVGGSLILGEELLNLVVVEYGVREVESSLEASNDPCVGESCFSEVSKESIFGSREVAETDLGKEVYRKGLDDESVQPCKKERATTKKTTGKQRTNRIRPAPPGTRNEFPSPDSVPPPDKTSGAVVTSLTKLDPTTSTGRASRGSRTEGRPPGSTR